MVRVIMPDGMELEPADNEEQRIFADRWLRERRDDWLRSIGHDPEEMAKVNHGHAVRVEGRYVPYYRSFGCAECKAAIPEGWEPPKQGDG